MKPAEVLAQPLTLPSGEVLPNRLLKSAMSEALGTADGAPRPELPRLYCAWADGGLGLSITGNVMVTPHALGEPGNVVVEDERHLPELRAWAQGATHGGAHAWVQLNHPGKQAPRWLNAENVAPSAVPFSPGMTRFFPTPRALIDAEIHQIVAQFARAAGVVKRAGFTGVQLHGAHGYLISQFLSPHHNRRTDEWGGTPENRRRFLLAVLAAVRAEVGPGFSVGVKLNSADFQRGGITEDEALDTIRALEAAGTDLIEISGGTYESPAMTGRMHSAGQVRASTREREAYFLTFATRARQAVRTPLAVTGGFRTLGGMAEAIESGDVDMVGLARALTLEPDLPRRLLSGLEARHPVKPVHSGVPVLDRLAFMEIAFYARQLRLIGSGQSPRPDESPLWTLVEAGVGAVRRGRGLGPLRAK